VTSRTFALVELVVAVAALAGAVLSWLASKSIETVPPILDGEPTMTATVYDPSLVLLALILGGVASVAAVAGIARLRSS
jgi:hypothetical protein